MSPMVGCSVFCGMRIFVVVGFGGLFLAGLFYFEELSLPSCLEPFLSFYSHIAKSLGVSRGACDCSFIDHY